MRSCIFLASLLHLSFYRCCFGADKQRHATPKRCISHRKTCHKTEDLTDSETPNKDESAVLASPTSSTCSPVPAICITPEMIAINILIEQKGQVNRKKRTAMFIKHFRTSPWQPGTLCCVFGQDM